MADLDRFAREVTQRVVPPDFDDLVRVARRRRRASVIGTAAGVTLLAVIGAYGAQGLAQNDATPAQPATNPGETIPTTPGDTVPTNPGDTVPTSSQPKTADEIVRDPSSYLAAFAAAQTDPDVRAAIWRCGEEPGCPGWRGGVAVTDDGFRSARVLDLPRGANLSVTDLGDGRFLVGDAPHGLVVAGDGSTVELSVSREAAPLADGEVLVPYWGRQATRTSGGIDPTSGRVHPLTLPAGDGLQVQQSGDLLYGALDTPDAQKLVVWSDDGGSSWHEADGLPSYPDDLYLQVPSATPQVMAWVVGGDGATLFPFDRVLRSTDRGRSWEVTEQGGEATAYLDFSLVLPDGRLLVSVEAWRDESAGVSGAYPPGLYVSEGDDWAELSPVEAQWPEGTDEEQLRQEPIDILDWSIGDAGEVVLWGWAPGVNTPVMVSDDSGRTWSEAAAR